MSKTPFIVGHPLERKFEDLILAAQLCFRFSHTTPGLVLIYSGMDVASWLASANPMAPVKQRFVHWVDRYIEPKKTLGCHAIELYSARCAIVHNFSSESPFTRKGTARKFVYVMEPSDPAVLRGKSITTLGYFGIAVGELVESFRKALSAMFEEAKSTVALAKRLREREAKVLQTISDEEGRAMFDWGDRLVAVGQAPCVEFLNASAGQVCELDNNCTAPATVRVRGLDSEGNLLAKLVACANHAENWPFAQVVDRRGG